MRIGSLFSGTGGLDMAVESVFPDAVPAWFCEWDDAPARILAHHWPDVPNLRDVTAVDWSAVEPVDIITGGFPCQDVSHAGRRQGLIRDGEGRTRSGLWGQMLRAIDTIRPPLVVAENVRGLLSATADSDVEPCPFCMGDGGASPMRALGAVLADLADIGYDAAWCGLRAADVGAAHGRFRVFILAWPAADTGHGIHLVDSGGVESQKASRQRSHEGERRGSADRGRGTSTEAVSLLPTPRASDPANTSSHSSAGFRPQLGEVARTLLPTPRATDGTKGGPNQRGSSGDLMLPSAVHLLPTPRTSDTNGPGVHGTCGQDLRTVVDLLPTPMVGSTSPAAHGQISGQYRDAMADALAHWGDYGPAIARWEAAIGRPAPAPTEPGARGNHRLSPRFVEWLMGLPAGHVTDPAIGLTRNQQLKALGNGVVPAQGAAALEWLLSVEAVTA